MDVTPRLVRWVDQEFPPAAAERVLAALRGLPDGLRGGQDPERLQAALVIRAAGDWRRFVQAVALAERDWRDVLVGAGLGDEDWRERLEARLGPRG